ncbi:MAG TPA: hypothetical protein VI139_08175 [Gemmatimonadales bacterium]
MTRRAIAVASLLSLLAVLLAAAIWSAWRQLLGYMLSVGAPPPGDPTLLACLTLGVVLVAILLPPRSPGARAAGIPAAISPLWVILPPAGFVIAIFAAPDRSPVTTLLSVVPVTLLLAELALTGWVMYRHRRWPWVAAPVVAVALVWTGRLVYGFAFAVLAAADR